LNIFPTTKSFATFTTIFVPVVTICIVWNYGQHISQVSHICFTNVKVTLSHNKSVLPIVEESSKYISHHRRICHLHHHLCSRHHLHCLQYYQPLRQVSNLFLTNVKVTLSHNQSVVLICVHSSSLCFCQEKTPFIRWSYQIGLQIACWGAPPIADVKSRV